MADQKTSIIISAEDRTGAALASVRNGLRGMEQSFAGLDAIASRIPLIGSALAGAFGALSFTGIIKGAIDAGDELSKMSQKLGISVADLAGFKYAAELSDLTLDQFAQGVKQASRYLGEHGDKLRAAGITATDAKGVMMQLADQFARMEDGPKKTAIAMEVMGKAGAEMIPLLNGGGAALRAMMEEGQRLNPVTEKMAKESEKFNDSLTTLKATVSGLSVEIAGPLVESLNKAIENFNRGREAGLGFFQAITGIGVRGFSESVADAMANSTKHIADLRKEIAGLEADRERQLAAGAKDSAASVQVAIDSATAKLRYYQKLQAEYLATNNAASYSNEGHGRELKPTLGGLLGSSTTKKTKTAKIFDPEGDMDFALDEALRKANRAGMDERAKSLDTMIAKYKELADPLQKYRDQLDEINSLRADGFLTAAQATEAEWSVNEAMDAQVAKMNDLGKATKEVDGFAKELGMTFTSAFEDAIVGGKEFGDVLKGLEHDIARIITRKTITEPIGNFVSSAVSSSGIGDWFKNLLPSFDVGTNYVPNDMLAVVHKGEAIIPAKYNTGGGGGVVINQSISVDSRSDRASIMAAMMAAKEQAKAEILSSMRRGGVFA